MVNHYKFKEPAENSITGQALMKIEGFRLLNDEFRRKMIINGYSINTYTNYARCIALLCLNFGTLPENITNVEIEMFLLDIKMNKKLSESYFKQTMGGISTLCKLTGHSPRKIKMPHIPRNERLPLVLSKKECRKIFLSGACTKHKMILMVAYSGGLRLSEVCSLKWRDIDFSGKRILIRAGKNRRDRYVVLSTLLIPLLKQHRKIYETSEYVFCGSVPGNPMSSSAVQGVFKDCLEKSSICKKVTLHTLRHSFATHLFEDGSDLLTIKEQLGHANIRHTLKYTHIVSMKRLKPHSPLDSLFKKKKTRKLLKGCD